MDNSVTSELLLPPTALAAPAGAAADPLSTWESRRGTAHWVFRGSLLVTGAITLVWLVFALGGLDGGAILGTFRFEPQMLVQWLVGFTIMQVLWGWLWYGVKYLLLRTLCGLSAVEARTTFTSRLNKPFDLQALLQGRSERRVRIADMVGRRGRYVTIGLLGFSFLYSTIAKDPKPTALTTGVQGNLIDALIFSWILLVSYRWDGWLGRVMWGPQARIMDGTLGRANCLLIGTLWSLFRFVMVPLGLQLGQVFPPATYATVFAFIWISYLTADASSEIVGSLLGKQKLRVWGMGEVNRKSIAGTWACFLGSLAVCSALVWANGLPAAWYGLALAVSVSNTVFELFSRARLGRLHDGDRQRPRLPGLRRARVLSSRAWPRAARASFGAGLRAAVCDRFLRRQAPLPALARGVSWLRLSGATGRGTRQPPSRTRCPRVTRPT